MYVVIALQPILGPARSSELGQIEDVSYHPAVQTRLLCTLSRHASLSSLHVLAQVSRRAQVLDAERMQQEAAGLKHVQTSQATGECTLLTLRSVDGCKQAVHGCAAVDPAGGWASRVCSLPECIKHTVLHTAKAHPPTPL